MSTIVNQAGAILRAAMEGRGLTVTECATRLQTSDRTIEGILDGFVKMPPPLAFRAAELFGTTCLLWLNAIASWSRSLEEASQQVLSPEAAKAREIERVIRISQAVLDVQAGCRSNPTTSELQTASEAARYLGDVGSYHDESLSTVVERTTLYEGVAALIVGALTGYDRDFRRQCLIALAVHDLSSFEVVATAITFQSDDSFNHEALKLLSGASPGLAQSRALMALTDGKSSTAFKKACRDLILSVLTYYIPNEGESDESLSSRIIQGETWWIRTFIDDASGFSALSLAEPILVAIQTKVGSQWEDAIDVLLARHQRLASHLLVAAARNPSPDIRIDALVRLINLDHPWAEEMAKQLTQDPDVAVRTCAERLAVACGA